MTGVMKTTFTKSDVHRIAHLANIPITPEEEEKLADGFNTTIAVVDELFGLEVQGVTPTHQVTGLENVFREDTVDEQRMFTQDQALSNATRTYNGFFVVDQVLEQVEP